MAGAMNEVKFASPEIHFLVTEILLFMEETGLGRHSFGKRAINNTHLVDRLFSGGDINTATVQRVREFMSSEARTRIQAREIG